ncbi:uncharacterized protein MONBRDRAFT_38840 [Monosiga brevicollis MX1]|uniref:VWFA domain-containing protein n=1 Tax=Monosiga brevicollis TaxID=81824 RepID=A9VAG7_MONBE|nr:uncharacterized protein MONBRDRAFT_38840 [Monosiga brevicollis MX1]EDQ85483.1 predicted protein [Monosiga brevicollis MX1]|eukprot:XP_001749674.1 hypothetical protein [Monosiga brevicollis MX1]
MLELFLLVVVGVALYYWLRGQRGSAAAGDAKYARFYDRYNSLDEVTQALRTAGLESCNLIIGVDFTKSNLTQGAGTFHGLSLHHMDQRRENPYQTAIRVLGSTLASFDDDNLIPAYGFGDITTRDLSCFSFFPDRACEGFGEVLTRYSELVHSVRLSGPTNFAPIIGEAIRIVKQTRGFHILVIIADGQVISKRQTIDAIVEASNYPLSILLVGVGDGPWDDMQRFDDELPERRFDNFQFVNFHKVMTQSRHPDVAFALAALMEIPQQFQAIRDLELI